jgi:hypothetical protein
MDFCIKQRQERQGRLQLQLVCGGLSSSTCKQDPFAFGTAQQYVWIDQAPDQAMPLVAMASEVPGSDEPTPAPALQLSSDDVRQQLRLVRTGLLGSGATAHAYACVWPDRFGETKLLAAKVWGWVIRVQQHCRPDLPTKHRETMTNEKTSEETPTVREIDRRMFELEKFEVAS